MDFVNHSLNFLLLFSNDMLLMFIAALIFITSKKDNYKHLVLLLLFVMILKTFLKDVFKIPAPATSPSLNYAFPSGHIYFATAFYLWIAFYKHSLKLGIFALIALSLTSGAIVSKGYHHLLEIILTFPLGIFTILIFNKISGLLKGRLTISLLIASLFYIAYVLIIGKNKIDAVIGMYGTIGFVFGNLLFKKPKSIISVLLPITALITCYIFTPDIKDFVKGIQWSFTYFAPPCIRFIKIKLARRLPNL